MASIKFILNGKPQTVDAIPEMPLLWVLRDTLNMTGTKFGCGVVGAALDTLPDAGYSGKASGNQPQASSATSKD